ncbi:hypothetical protein CXU09_03500 [Akkermansia muciniphila]|uniref:Uncharacterized protein n=1 Tax=Akkermansia muciniphila TaxID=239935 RepID=A0AAP8NLQ6_9BACT|nr:hypothetical protein CXU09_03500 [Akkermansia muciniphila]
MPLEGFLKIERKPGNSIGEANPETQRETFRSALPQLSFREEERKRRLSAWPQEGGPIGDSVAG